MFKTWAAAIIILCLSLVIVYHKGYFNVASFKANDSEIQEYLNLNFAHRVLLFNLKNSDILENLTSKYSYIKDIKLKIKPNLSVEVSYNYRQVVAISDKENLYISNDGVLFYRTDWVLKPGVIYPIFVYGGQKIGDSVFRPEEMNYLKELQIYPRVTLSNNNSKTYIKPVDYDWFLEVVALADSEKSSRATNQLLKELNDSKKHFSSILIMGDRLIEKD